MTNIIGQWYRRSVSNPHIVSLFLVLVGCFLVFHYMGHILAPAFVAIIIAYLLQGFVSFFERWHIPHKLAVAVVYLLFIGVLIVALLGLLPLLWRQLTTMINEFPQMLVRGQDLLMTLPQRYPSYVTAEQVNDVLTTLKSQLAQFGRVLLSLSISSIPGIFSFVIYFVVVPLLVFFFLMDKKVLITWFSHYLPRQRQLVGQIWQEVNQQIGNYVRGKVIEILMVSVTTYICFALMDLQFAMILSLSVGLSVVIPYIGAVLVTVPVVIIAFLQWGLQPHFFYLLLAYAIIVTLDANILIPLLFSEVMSLHPVAIILAVIVFGGLWGFWGIFFAIPLATVVKAILTAWPRESE